MAALIIKSRAFRAYLYTQFFFQYSDLSDVVVMLWFPAVDLEEAFIKKWKKKDGNDFF